MASNTKLTPEQKTILRNLKKATTMPGRMNRLAGVQVVNVDNVTTIAFIERGNTVEFSLAVRSPDENKFRTKVGEFYALERFYNSETVKMARADFAVMCEMTFDAYLI